MWEEEEDGGLIELWLSPGRGAALSTWTLFPLLHGSFIKTCSTFENINVSSCKTFLGSSDFADISLTLPLILFTFHFLVKNSWRYLSDCLWAHDGAKVPLWCWVADQLDFHLRYWWRKYSDTSLKYKYNNVKTFQKDITSKSPSFKKVKVQRYYQQTVVECM